MSLLNRAAVSKWQRVGSRVTVVGEKSVLAGGRGLNNTADLAGPIKKEGDKKAPAGIFRLSRVFGYAPRAQTKMPYLALSPSIVGIDDPQSRYYNQLFDRSKIEKRDWHTAEEMFREDDRYK